MPRSRPKTCEALRRLTARRRLAHLARPPAYAALALGLALGVLGLADLAVVWREPAALGLCLAALAASLAALAVLAWRDCRRLPGDRDTALLVEAACPELMDALVCAVELGQLPEAELSPLQHALLANVERQLAGRDLARLLSGTAGGSLVRPLAAGLGALLLLGATHFLPFAAKARAQALDLLRGRATGLTVAPGDLELPRGADLRIVATLHRGPDRAELRLFGPDGERRYDMFAAAPGQQAFDLYAVGGDLAYQVRTPTLASRVYRLRTFAKPELLAVRLRVVPPAYTGLPAQEFKELTDFSAAQGARVTIEAEGNMDLAASLRRAEGEPLRLAPVGLAAPRHYRAEFVLTQTIRFRLALEDGQGRSVVGPREYRAECVPDLPPVIVAISPRDDAAFDKTATVPLAFEASDDYGLRRIVWRYAVNGGDWRSVELFAAPAGGERLLKQRVAHALDLSGQVDYGDVVAYHCQAEDNAEPQPHTGAGELRFLEIRPPRPEDLAQAQGGGQQEAGLNVSDLILQQKQLLRNTWRRQHEPDPDRRKTMLDELSREASDLQLAASKRYHELQEKTAGLSLGPLDTLFPAALKAMETSSFLLHRGLGEESLSFQQTALAKLVAIEVELQKNSAARQASGQGGQGQGQPPPPEITEKDRQQERQARLAQLDKALRSLDELIRRQEALTGRLQQQHERLPPEQSRYLGQQQENVQRETQRLDRELASLDEVGSARQELDRATNSMGQVRERLGRDEVAGAGKDAELAGRFLGRARELLEQLRQDLAGGQLSQAQRRLQDLQQRQAALRQQTQARQAGQAQAPAPAALARGQQQAREALEPLLQDLREVANSLQSQNPEAARRLGAALGRSDEANVAGKMKRAENALRFQRLDKAVENQQEAEAGLQALAKDLEEAAGLAQQPSADELLRLLQQTLAALERNRQLAKPQTSESARREFQQQLLRQLQDLAGRSRSPELQKLLQEYRDLGGGGGTVVGPEKIESLLTRAAAQLERQLLDAARQRQLQLARLGGQLPPDEYRKLVDQYFEALGKDEK